MVTYTGRSALNASGYSVHRRSAASSPSGSRRGAAPRGEAHSQPRRMVHAVVEDARTAVQAGVDAVALEPRPAPRAPAAARQRHPAVLPILIGQPPDASADLLEILSAGAIPVASVDLHAVHATSAGRCPAAWYRGIRIARCCPPTHEMLERARSARSWKGEHFDRRRL